MNLYPELHNNLITAKYVFNHVDKVVYFKTKDKMYDLEDNEVTESFKSLSELRPYHRCSFTSIEISNKISNNLLEHLNTCPIVLFSSKTSSEFFVNGVISAVSIKAEILDSKLTKINFFCNVPLHVLHHIVKTIKFYLENEVL